MRYTNLINMKILYWIQKNTYPVHLAAFIQMILASAGMYIAAGMGSLAMIWVCMAVFILANLLALAAR